MLWKVQSPRKISGLLTLEFCAGRRLRRLVGPVEHKEHRCHHYVTPHLSFAAFSIWPIFGFFTVCSFCYCLPVVTSLDQCLPTLSICVCALETCLGWTLWNLWECGVCCLSCLVPPVLSLRGSPTQVFWGHSPSSQPPPLLPNSWPSCFSAGRLLLLHLSPPSFQTPSASLWDQPACYLLSSWVAGAQLASTRAQERPEMPLAPFKIWEAIAQTFSWLSKSLALWKVCAAARKTKGNGNTDLDQGCCLDFSRQRMILGAFLLWEDVQIW